MRLKLLLLGFGLLIPILQSNAQLVIGAKEKQQVVLYSGDTLQSDSITYEFLTEGDPYFRLDHETRFTSDSVKFITNFHGTFVNLRTVNRSSDPERYAKRIKNGKVKVYEEIEMEIYGGKYLAIQRTGRRLNNHPELASGDKYDFYSVHNDTIRKVNYRNLKYDLWGNEKSREELQVFKRFRYLQIGMIAAGAGIAGASLLFGDASGEFTPITATGIVVAACSVFIEFPKKNALKNAIDYYN
ncbi:hypothetical protein [Halocola ammonii]